MKKRIISVLLILSVTTAVAAMAAGCGKKPADGTDKDSNGSTSQEGTGSGGHDGKEEDSITFMAPDWAIPTDDQLQAFTDETGIQVMVNEVGWDDIRDKMITASAGGNAAADVVEVDWSWVGEFYAAGWLEPLEVSDETRADIPTLETFTKDGNVLAIPYANDYRLSYYNTKQYEDAGIQGEPQTWDEVYANCKFLKEKGVCYTELHPGYDFEWKMFDKPVNGPNGPHNGYSWCGGRCRWGTRDKLSVIERYCKGAIEYVGIAADEVSRLEKERKGSIRGSFAFFEIRDKVEGLMSEMEELAGHMEVCNAILAVASTKEGCSV